MKTLYLIVTLSALSLLVMLVVDLLIGSRAEFLNAWSVVERLFGRTPAAGDSIVYRRVGAVGELVAVLLANLAVGTIVGGVVKVVFRR